MKNETDIRTVTVNAATFNRVCNSLSVVRRFEGDIWVQISDILHPGRKIKLKSINGTYELTVKSWKRTGRDIVSHDQALVHVELIK